MDSKAERGKLSLAHVKEETKTNKRQCSSVQLKNP